jgi:small subunit ribosomal protein S6
LKTVIRKAAPSRKRKVKGESKLYEAMFLVDQGEAATDWEGVTAAIKSILEKAGAEIVLLEKWGERKLAYEIKGRGKGTYILCYFRVVGSRIRDIERDIQLSERIMRALILCVEHLTVEDIEKSFASQDNSKRTAQKQTAEEQKQTEQKEEAEKSEPVDNRPESQELSGE